MDLTLYSYCANNPVYYVDPSRNTCKSGNDRLTYQTYTKINSTTGEVYSSITSGIGKPRENIRNRDINHHMNNYGFGPAQLDKTSDNYYAIRGREQMLIKANGGAKSKGLTSGNRINGIGDNNKKKNLYLNEARKEFGDIE